MDKNPISSEIGFFISGQRHRISRLEACLIEAIKLRSTLNFESLAGSQKSHDGIFEQASLKQLVSVICFDK